jgi:DNA-binding protein Fis
MDKAKATLAAAMTVNEISPAEKDRLRERVKPVVDKFAKSLDGDLVKTMYDEIAKVRAAH